MGVADKSRWMKQLIVSVGMRGRKCANDLRLQLPAARMTAIRKSFSLFLLAHLSPSLSRYQPLTPSHHASCNTPQRFEPSLRSSSRHFSRQKLRIKEGASNEACWRMPFKPCLITRWNLGPREGAVRTERETDKEREGKREKNAHRPSNRTLKGLNTNEAERKAIIQRSNSWQPSPGLTLSLRGSHLGVHSNSGVLWAFSLLLLLLSTSLQSKSWIGIHQDEVRGERERNRGVHSYLFVFVCV